ncbi:hypothetical protein TPR58_20670 [Sphingomonas sp. HF-S3]|uniref:Uncharacterized protein n=1 Tax=Sphingomonas rustica TaxID=3103142 RepID=A0ABV0BDK8_9SPHN
MDVVIFVAPALLWGVIAWAVMWWLGRRRWWVSILIIALAPIVTFYPVLIYSERLVICSDPDCGPLIFVAMLIFAGGTASAALVGAAVGAALGLWRPRA